MRLKLTQNGYLPIRAKLRREILTAARRAMPNEACGLLLGHAGRITAVRETANVHPTPQTHFEIDPQALIDAHRAEREGGPDVLGYFHSHPSGPPEPSATDAAMAVGDGRIWAIVAGSQLMIWRDDPQGFQSLSYRLMEC